VTKAVLREDVSPLMVAPLHIVEGATPEITLAVKLGVLATTTTSTAPHVHICRAMFALRRVIPWRSDGTSLMKTMCQISDLLLLQQLHMEWT
jgi:hypothetical protein